MKKHTVLTVLAAAGLGLGAISVASADTYPRDLFEQHKELRQQYQKLVSPVADQHTWVKKGGTETPVSTIKLNGHKYTVMSSCKPHDCPSEKLITLVDRKHNQASGALVENSGDQGSGPEQSKITWLGEPGAGMRSYMAAYLFSQ